MRLAEHRRSARARHGRSHRAEAPSAELSAAASGGRGRGIPPAGLPGAGVPGVGRCVPCDRQGLRDANGLKERNSGSVTEPQIYAGIHAVEAGCL